MHVSFDNRPYIGMSYKRKKSNPDNPNNFNIGNDLFWVFMVLCAIAFYYGCCN